MTTTEHTSQLQQYVTIVSGRHCLMWKRPKKKGMQQYTAPQPVGSRWFRNKTEALKFKAEYDKPMDRNDDRRH